jgi:FKBP-type peptidyl-prolyl cis-trans isomerase FklB
MNTKTTALTILAILTTTGVLHADGTNSPFKDDKEKASYAIGLNFGSNWKRQEIEVDYDAFVRGLKDAENDKKLLTEDEVRSTISKFSQELEAKRQEKRRQLGEKNKKDGEAFLAANKDKPGVITSASGLQHKILAEGSGDSPKAEDTVTVNYRGTLIDGTEFDSSAKNGRPASFRVDGVIRGWTEALTEMKPGAKRQLFIPSSLAYGEFGRPPQIGPNSTLIFEIELVSIQTAPPRAPLTSDIIKVPSLDEMKKGAKIETIKAEDLEKLQKQEQEKKKQ